MADAFKPINDGGFQRYPYNAYKQWIVTNSNYRDDAHLISILKGISPLHNQIIPVSKSINGTVGHDTTELDNSNSNNSDPLSMVHQKTVWSAVNQVFYSTRGVMERNLFASASIFSVPQNRMGDGIKPGSITITDKSPLPLTAIGEEGGDDAFVTLTITDNKIDEYHGELIDSGLTTTNYTLQSDLIGYWGFNEKVADRTISFDNKIYDKSGYLNHAVGADLVYDAGIKTTSTVLSSGTKVTLNGSSSYIRVNHNPQLEFTRGDDYAISLWTVLPVSQSDTSDGWNSIISKNGAYKTFTPPLVPNGTMAIQQNLFPTTYNVINTPTSIYPFDLRVYNQTTANYSGSVIATISDGLVSTQITSSTVINDSTAHHIVFNKNGDTLELWIDGTKESEASIASIGQVWNTYDMLMGSKFLHNAGVVSNFKSLNGALDEVRIYRKALTSVEIGTLATNAYNNGSAYQTNVIGEVFYKHGLMVISDPRPIYNNVFTGRSGSWDYTAGGDTGFTTKYKSTKQLHEVSVMCEIDSNDFNVSQNVSLRKNNDINSSLLKGFVTGSDFKPYFTTIGLYNSKGDLLAIGKMGSAIQIRQDCDITVKVRFDIDGPFGPVTVNELPQETEKDALTQDIDGNFIWNHV